jgi:hypothetical protein
MSQRGVHSCDDWFFGVYVLTTHVYWFASRDWFIGFYGLQTLTIGRVNEQGVGKDCQTKNRA